jgi:hypothetical protein
MAISLLLLAYIVDHLSVVYRIPNGRPQFGSVQVRKFLTIKLKNRKTEFVFQPSEAQPCVNSLFPQLGLGPCWYKKRHPTQETDY